MDNEQLTQEVMSLKEHQAKAEAQHERFEGRIDKLETEVKENRELTAAVKEIATEIKYLREDQTDMNKRLKKIEEKPIKNYEETKKQIRNYAIVFVFGIALTFLAIKLGLGNYL